MDSETRRQLLGFAAGVDSIREHTRSVYDGACTQLEIDSDLRTSLKNIEDLLESLLSEVEDRLLEVRL